VDVTDVECIVIARLTKSLIVHIQMCGRGLRLHEGKEKCLFLDHAGNFTRLGWPDERQQDYLDDGKKRDNKPKKTKERIPHKCPSCHYLKPIGIHKCPKCGLIAEKIKNVDVIEGELKKLQRKDRKKYSIQEKQDFLAGLNAYAENKNYKQTNGVWPFALYTYKEKFGSRPSNKINWYEVGNISEEVYNFIKHKQIKYAKRKI
ncbi:unnamed protein product, partial [marine sediment metagenome]